MAEPFTTSSGTAVLWNLDAAESFRVIKASALLTPNMKLLWMEDHLLSRAQPSRGSFLSAEKMGRRLRLALSTVEQMRRSFLSIELYLRKGKTTATTWMPCLPAEAVAPRGTNSDELFLELADRLDAHIRRRLPAVPPSFFYVFDYLNVSHGIPRDIPTESHGSDPPHTVGDSHGMRWDGRARRRSLALREGGLGGVPSQETLKESSLLTDPEREGKSLTRLKRREEPEGRDGGAGEERGVDPEVIRREMTALKERLDQGAPTDG